MPSSEIDIFRDQPLGSGSHGTVFLAKWRGVDVAVKVLRSDGQVDRRLIASFKDEVRVLAALQHPLLIRMLFFNKEQLAIGLEYLKEFVPLPSVLQADRKWRGKAAAGECGQGAARCGQRHRFHALTRLPPP